MITATEKASCVECVIKPRRRKVVTAVAARMIPGRFAYRVTASDASHKDLTNEGAHCNNTSTSLQTYIVRYWQGVQLMRD